MAKPMSDLALTSFLRPRGSIYVTFSLFKLEIELLNSPYERETPYSGRRVGATFLAVTNCVGGVEHVYPCWS